MTNDAPTIWISAGDVSGDRIGADLARSLHDRCPSARLVGMGGAQMAQASVDLRVDGRALAIGGIIELVPSLGRIFTTARRARRALAAADPDLVILIDSGGFHLPLARFVRKRLRARVLYYVAPQVWVWRTGRMRKLAARTDRRAVILPFEPAFYAKRGVVVDYVGHPILDGPIAQEPVVPPDARSGLNRSTRNRETPGEVRLGLFPGSRRNELGHHLPLQLAVLRRLRESRPELRGVIALAPSLDRSAVQTLIEDQARPGDPAIEIVDSDARLLDTIDVALTKPGTITLELLLRETPMVVIGIAQAASAAFVQWVAKVNWVALPNLIAGRGIVPERIQSDASVDRISADLAPLFPTRDTAGRFEASPAAEEQREAFRAAREVLGDPGASGRVAEIALELIEEASVGTDRT